MIKSEDDYTIHEFHPGKFVKIKGGKVTCKATFGEFFCHQFRTNHQSIDSGIIQTSLAITAIAGLGFSSGLGMPEKIIAGICFLLSVISSSLLGWYFVVMRIPTTISEQHEFLTHLKRSYNKREKANTLFLKKSINKAMQYTLLWLIFYYPWLVIKITFLKHQVQDEIECGYLSLIASLALLAIVAIILGF